MPKLYSEEGMPKDNMRRRRLSGRAPGLSLRALAGSSPACVAYKEFQEKTRQQILEAFTLSEKFVIIGKAKRIRWRIKWV